ncbi:MAG: OmpH family outer membrane protein [Candidatus Omnitrophica bacterium]|nr:OmpH family outer membrane protein [Candidatus Omnitrophota bacterium]MCM8789263.1 OmpH family outer membrane protein [Candidatus Omnitrophota bacterium]
MKFFPKAALIVVGILFVSGYVFSAVQASRDAPKILKVGYVNIEMVFDQYKKTAESREEFEKERENQQKEIAKKQEELRKAQESYEKQKDILKPEEKKKSEEEIQKLQQEFYNFVGLANQKLDEKKGQLIENRLKEIQDAIKDFAIKEKYDFILNSQAIFYGPEGADITDQIIKFLNKEKK